MRFPASVKVLLPVWLLKNFCVKDIQVQNTCNKQQKKKHVDWWLEQIVQEYTRKWTVMISFFYLQVPLIRAVLQMTKELRKQRTCELSNQIIYLDIKCLVSAYLSNAITAVHMCVYLGSSVKESWNRKVVKILLFSAGAILIRYRWSMSWARSARRDRQDQQWAGSIQN